MTLAGRKLAFLIATLSAAMLTIGCPPPPPPPSADEILRALSYAVLQPDTTCAELRQDFNLEDLPVVDNPGEVDIPYAEYEVAAPDGQALRVWYMPVDSPKGLVVVSSGNSGSMACYLFTARLLTADGWSVITYDYEGFGGSSGSADLLSLRGDLEAVIDWAVTRTGSPQLTLFGMSLGTIPTVAAAVDRPDAVNAVILDSPVALDREIERFANLVHGQAREIIAVLEPWLMTDSIVAAMTQPALVFLHSADKVTPPSTVQLMLQNAGSAVQVVEFEGLGHAAGQFLRTEEYNADLVAFLGQVW
jgi:pimeloyl-ACP methyl ester carboxylesterase